MDGGQLAFRDGQFDAVYAPYVINVVPDPVRVAREMIRVCKPGGRLVWLNHFDRLNGSSNAINRVVGMVAKSLSGVNWHLDFPDFIERIGVVPLSVDSVNVPRVSSFVLCRKA
jgi:phosphatidylethanolamine/phosphatidyl-N-methylethanolamine N-methyltransferase